MNRICLCSLLVLFTIGSPGLAIAQTEADPEPMPPPAASPSPAPGIAPQDVVILENGGMVRGTIAELVPDGEVTIILLSGGTRTFPMAEVQYAGPASGAPEIERSKKAPADKHEDRAKPMVTVHGKEARVSVVGRGKGQITLHRRSASAAGPAGIAFGFDVVCTAPCDFSMPAGTHSFAVSRGDDTPTEHKEGVTLPAGHSRLEADTRDRSGTRAGGYVVGFGGLLVGMGLPFLILKDEGSDSPSMAGYLLGLGVVVGATGWGVSLASTPDDVTIVVSPMSASQTTPARSRRMGDAPTDTGRPTIDGMAISAVF